MNFKKWIKQNQVNEVGTSTASVASFPRMVIPSAPRQWPSETGKKKKKRKNST